MPPWLTASRVSPCLQEGIMAAAPRQMFHKVFRLPENRETERLCAWVFFFFLQEVIDNPASCCWCTWGPLRRILIRLFACSSRCCGKSGFDFGAAWGCRFHFSARFVSAGGRRGGVQTLLQHDHHRDEGRRRRVIKLIHLLQIIQKFSSLLFFWSHKD